MGLSHLVTMNRIISYRSCLGSRWKKEFAILAELGLKSAHACRKSFSYDGAVLCADFSIS